MGRIIELTVNDKVYLLEFNRRTLLLATDIQKDIENAKTPAEQYSVFTKFVHYALMKNHPNITSDEIDTIVESIEDYEMFSKALNEIIENSVNTLKENKGNSHWVVK